MVHIENESEPEEFNSETPQDFVVVLAYTSTDGEIDENFGQFVQDIKALYTFKDNVRAYALVEGAAKRVLSKVEKPEGEPTNKAALVISFEQPGDTDKAIEKLSGVVERVRDIFKDEPDVEVRVAIRESADEVLGVFQGAS